MSENTSYFAYAELNGRLQQRKDAEAMDQSKKFIELIWDERGLPMDMTHNIDGGSAVYHNIYRGPTKRLGKKPISSVNG